MMIEKRTQTDAHLTVETRAEGKGFRLGGVAAPYNSLSHDLGGFREIILPGAFRSVLASDPDVRALRNHNTDKVLGRTLSNTLELRESDEGLGFSVDLPDVSYARDLHTLVSRGDISGASFAFNVDPEDYDIRYEGDELIREIRNIPKLYEISIVTFPAYEESQVSARFLKDLETFKTPKTRNYVSLYNLKIRMALEAS